MKKFFYILSIFLLSAVTMLTACTDADEPAQPAGPRTYRMRLLADLQIPRGFATRAAYTFPDKAQLYVLFHQGSAAVTGTAVYDASSGLWTITPSQSLSEVTDGSCRLTYLIDAGQASASSVAVTQSTRIYADVAASFSLAADLLTVQAHLTPTLGRIRFRGAAGQAYTFTGLALATTFDVKTHAVNSLPTKLTATCAADGYTPYFYATFADAAARQLTFEFNATTGFRRAFGESVLQAGVSGYITIPTAEKHDGWTLVNLSTGKEVTFATVSKPAASNVLSDRATLSATVTSTGGGTLSDAGFVIATHATPTISDRRISLGSKTTLSSVISQLTPNTKYYIRAYAVNELGVAYGEEISITTGAKEESDVEREEWGNEENWDNDGGKENPQGLCPDSNHPHAIDLGLGVKFACCNVGADSPIDFVNCYAWGETLVKNEYNWSGYKWGNSSIYMRKYCVSSYQGSEDKKTTLELPDDAAYANWDDSWRTPTSEELNKLNTECNWKWITVDGVDGYQVTAKNGNFIFLPAAGHRSGTGLSGIGTSGLYWSSSLDVGSCCRAECLFFERSARRMSYYDRCYGLSVRPVTE